MGLTLASNQVIKKRLWKPRTILRTAKHLFKITLILSSLSVIQSSQQRYFSHSSLKYGMVRGYQVTTAKVSSYKFLKQLHCRIVTIDGVHKESLWSTLRAYSIHVHIVRVIKQFCIDFHCSVGCSNLNFHVKSGVRQGLVMSALLFNIVIIIDRALCRATECKRRGIRWTLSTVLEDIACRRNRFAISFFSWHPEENTNYNRLERFAQQVGLQVISLLMEVLPVNISAPLPIKIGQLHLKTTEQSTYLGSIVCSDGRMTWTTGEDR